MTAALQLCSKESGETLICRGTMAMDSLSEVGSVSSMGVYGQATGLIWRILCKVQSGVTIAVQTNRDGDVDLQSLVSAIEMAAGW